MRKQWPNITTCLNIQVHNEFLMQATPQKTAEYCIQRIIKPMLIISLPSTENHKESVETLVLRELHEIVVKSWSFAFGCALCHTFFKWLVSEEMNYNTKSYWEISQEYLNPDFKPGLIEQFLVIKWKEELFNHLSVKES
uniref:Uncharacterized protein n=1 Tax=Strigamia maritima TaxID=126957 RepID=T1JBI8_STRMM